MIEDSTTWYLGTVGSGSSYKLAKYTDTNMSSVTEVSTNAKAGLLRLGELMTGQFDRYDNNISYWILTPFNTFNVYYVDIYDSVSSHISSDVHGIRPSLNLKSNVIITGGDGTKNNPFTLGLDD